MTERRRVAFVVNGMAPSPMGLRARAFAARLPDFEIGVIYRRPGPLAFFQMTWELLKLRPALVYVFDIGSWGILAALVYNFLTRAPLVVDTGDPICELGAALGRGTLGMLCTQLLERSAYENAAHVVVRGTQHKTWLCERGFENVTVIQDGVETELFFPRANPVLRAELGVGDDLLIGLVGSSVWSEQRQMCYGWDLIEALGLLKGRAVKALLIGGGSGFAHLQRRCDELGIRGRVIFLGYTPYERLPGYLNAMDVCLSTQSNDLIGRFRTTGKLPLYLACGKYILASRVGEAERVLPEEMLVPYDGIKDDNYPAKLAGRIDELLRHRERLALGAAGVETARRTFDYGELSARLNGVLKTMLGDWIETKGAANPLSEFVWSLKVFGSRMKNYGRYLLHAPFLYENWLTMIFANWSRDLVTLRLRNGLRFKVRPGATDRATVNEIFILCPYTSAPGFALKDGAVVVDVGANIGAFSLRAVSSARNIRIVSLEPVSGNFNRLAENVRLNNVEHAKIFRGAIGKEDGEIDLDVAGAASSAHFNRPGTVREKVRMYSLETLFREGGVAAIDLLKMDCEGAEFDALLPCKPEVIRRCKRIAMEFHNLSPEKNAETLKTFLSGIGYDVTVIGKDWCGLLLATRRD